VPIKGGRTARHLLVTTLYKLALAGDVQAIKLLIDRHDGKLAESPDANMPIVTQIDTELARRILEVADPDTLPLDADGGDSPGGADSAS
jgi:hypothetical protein